MRGAAGGRAWRALLGALPGLPRGSPPPRPAGRSGRTCAAAWPGRTRRRTRPGPSPSPPPPPPPPAPAPGAQPARAPRRRPLGREAACSAPGGAGRGAARLRGAGGDAGRWCSPCTKQGGEVGASDRPLCSWLHRVWRELLPQCGHPDREGFPMLSLK